jgi:hypothetical protein
MDSRLLSERVRRRATPILLLAIGVSCWTLSSSVAGEFNGKRHMGHLPHHRALTYGSLSYCPGIYPGFQGFGLSFHLGYGYGGYGLGTGAFGGYPNYGGPGYPCNGIPFQPEATGPLRVKRPAVLTSDPGPLDFGPFTGAPPVEDPVAVHTRIPEETRDTAPTTGFPSASTGIGRAQQTR